VTVTVEQSRRPGREAGGRRTRERSFSTAEPQLACRIRLADGRVFCGELPAAKHRAIQLGMLHGHSAGFVELTPGTRPPGGKLEVDRRDDSAHFLPGGAAGRRHWLDRLLAHAERIVAGRYAPRFYQETGGSRVPREECFLGVAPRTVKQGRENSVAGSGWLWVDIDDPDRLDLLYAFLAERPCHLLVSSGGSGGVHAYWKLDRTIPAERVDPRTGEIVELIDRANGRLVARVGGDAVCRDRARVLRLAGTRNYKRGEWARIIDADLALAPYEPGELVDDLPDPETRLSRKRSSRPDGPHDQDDDPYRRIPAVEYMARLAGRYVNRKGFVRCPAPGHEDKHPSCHVGGPNPALFQCKSCGAAGSIFDLASIVLGGPYGSGQLHDEAFKRARDLVVATFGEQPTEGGSGE
jgi:hypothetical protein